MPRSSAEHIIDLPKATDASLKKQLSDVKFAAWLQSAQTLLDRSGNPALINLYAVASMDVINIVGTQIIADFSKTLLLILTNAGHSAATAFLNNTPLAFNLLKQKKECCYWLTSISELAAVVPQQVSQVCHKTPNLLQQLDALGFHRWVVSGISLANQDADRLERYFSLEDSASLNILEIESSDVRFVSMEKRLVSLVVGLWRFIPVLRTVEINATQQHLPRRPSFDNNVIRMPISFPNFHGQEAENLFKAAVTHIAAHREYTRELFLPKALKPIQIAIISILEDSRVELLAAQRYPGLLALWQSFHRIESTHTEASGTNNAACYVVADMTPTTEHLLSRLSRALIDPDYIDDNPWIKKGRKMFTDAGPKWENPEDLRRIGVLLGNDLGQMRLQFNAKTYVVQPPYRDDNNGLWDFGNSPPEQAEQADLIHGAFRPEQTDNLEDPPEREKSDQNAQQEKHAGKARRIEEQPGIPVAKCSEWDYRALAERPDWVTIKDYELPSAPSRIIDYLLSQHKEIEYRISSLIKQTKVGRPQRLKRQPEGDRLDLDACIQTRIDYASGIPGNGHIYEHSALLQRDLSILVLLDISESTKDLINGTTTSIFSMERVATALLAQAMSGIGDPFAIRAFCSNGRHDLHYYRIKDFEEAYDDASKSRLAALKPGFSTRMGAALRYASVEINQQQNYRRLVLVITDGEPSDIDVHDQKYLTEDARKAVNELSNAGVNVFAVGLGGVNLSYLSRIFGQRNIVKIEKIERLPEKLPLLYFRLTM